MNILQHTRNERNPFLKQNRPDRSYRDTLLKESRFVEDVLFYPNYEVGAFPKIEIKWDWVSDIHVYGKFEAVIWS